METNNTQKSFQRAISNSVVQMSRSLACRIWVLGFFCGFCITCFFLVIATPYGSTEPGLIFSTASVAKTNSYSLINQENPLKPKQHRKEDRIRLLYSAWSLELNNSESDPGEVLIRQFSGSNIPRAPHLENCKQSSELYHQLDRYNSNGTPPWYLWRGLMGQKLLQESLIDEEKNQDYVGKFEAVYPPWIVGSDEENYPFTRRVQKDIWIHQHPLNCRDPNLRFLVADWETLPGFGMGAQLVGMAGLLAIAINENRILVTNYYNRADHNGCEGSLRSSWSCYFLPETSEECREEARLRMSSSEAWNEGIVTAKSNYTSKEIWAGRVPRVWGAPWKFLQPTTDVDGNLLVSHRKMDRRWWRAQAVRYLMRFQTEYTCNLVNAARHEAFGHEVSEMVAENLPSDWPKVEANKRDSDIEKFVWSTLRPLTLRPILSMHVRMGDKACEMKVAEFKEYMVNAERIRKRFPTLNSIWLSTEMQDVIDKTEMYPDWKFYYTKIRRQVGNTTMAEYEASLGREISTNYPLVNLIMAGDSDFFIGALGSTWCFLIDGLRNTGGKVMAGYLSVNKDRFW